MIKFNPKILVKVALHVAISVSTTLSEIVLDTDINEQNLREPFVPIQDKTSE